MLRIMLTLIVSASIGRWFYSEIELVAPPLVPVINSVLNATELPTHDKWSKDSFEELLQVVDGVAQTCVTSFAKHKTQQPQAKPKIVQQIKVKRAGPTFKEINHQLALLQESLNVGAAGEQG